MRRSLCCRVGAQIAESVVKSEACPNTSGEHRFAITEPVTPSHSCPTEESRRVPASGNSGAVQLVSQRLIWDLELRPSLLKMWVMWVSTVRSDRNSLAAVCLL